MPQKRKLDLESLVLKKVENSNSTKKATKQ